MKDALHLLYFTIIIILAPLMCSVRTGSRVSQSAWHAIRIALTCFVILRAVFFSVI